MISYIYVRLTNKAISIFMRSSDLRNSLQALTFNTMFNFICSWISGIKVQKPWKFYTTRFDEKKLLIFFRSVTAVLTYFWGLPAFSCIQQRKKLTFSRNNEKISSVQLNQLKSVSAWKFLNNKIKNIRCKQHCNVLVLIDWNCSNYEIIRRCVRDNA